VFIPRLFESLDRSVVSRLTGRSLSKLRLKMTLTKFKKSAFV
jgi:hypothetical protein